VVHRVIDYPGVPVDHALVEERHGILRDVRVPIRPHFEVMPTKPRFFGWFSAKTPLGVKE
jgi:hypothetical protein